MNHINDGMSDCTCYICLEVSRRTYVSAEFFRERLADMKHLRTEVEQARRWLSSQEAIVDALKLERDAAVALASERMFQLLRATKERDTARTELDRVNKLLLIKWGAIGSVIPQANKTEETVSTEDNKRQDLSAEATKSDTKFDSYDLEESEL